MKFVSKLLGLEADPRERLRPLWHRVIEIARDPHWYRSCKVSDTVDGRFDMITAVLSVVLVRLEASDILRGESALLTELFVEDMDGQLREFGINDAVMGKRMGKLMGVMGGRLGAYRPALLSRDMAKFDIAIERNVNIIEGGDAIQLRDNLIAFADRIAELSDDEMIAATGVALG